MAQMNVMLVFSVRKLCDLGLSEIPLFKCGDIVLGKLEPLAIGA